MNFYAKQTKLVFAHYKAQGSNQMNQLYLIKLMLETVVESILQNKLLRVCLKFLQKIQVLFCILNHIDLVFFF